MVKKIEVNAADKLSPGYYAYGVLHRSNRFSDWEASKGDRYHEYRKEWNSRVERRDHGDIPLNLNVEVTTRCNLACTFCSHPSLTRSQTGDLPIELFKKVLGEADTSGGIRAVNLNGLGEPMLRSDLTKFIEASKDHGAEDVYFHTNGTLLETGGILDGVLEAGLDRIIVSVDSPDKETYEQMRLIKGSWDSKLNQYKASTKGFKHEKLISGVKRLLARIRSNNLPVMVRVTCVLTAKTFHQMKDFVSFWTAAGADLITYTDLTWSEKLSDEDKNVQGWVTSETAINESELESLRADVAGEHSRNFVCPQLFQSVWLEFDGNYVPCSHPDARTHMKMGNANSESLQEVWEGEEYRKLRALHLAGRWSEHPICGKCEVPLIEIQKRIKESPSLPIDLVQNF